MKKQEVLERWCKLSAKVQNEKFNCSVPADCFCGTNPLSTDVYFQFSNEIMEFIENAVEEKLNA